MRKRLCMPNSSYVVGKRNSFHFFPFLFTSSNILIHQFPISFARGCSTFSILKVPNFYNRFEGCRRASLPLRSLQTAHL